MRLLNLAPILFYLLVSFMVTACRNNSLQSIESSSHNLSSQRNNSNSDSSNNMMNKRGLLATTESKIIFVTIESFSGDFISEVKRKDNGKQYYFDGLKAANALCNKRDQQKSYESINKTYINRIPESYIGTKNGVHHYYRALLQGNNATETGVTYYGVEPTGLSYESNGYIYHSARLTAQPIATATGPNLLGFNDKPLNNAIFNSDVVAWTGLTPTGTYDGDAIGEIAAGIYNFLWIAKMERDSVLSGAYKSTKINQRGLNQVMFACGKFNSGSFDSATSWSSAESTQIIDNGAIVAVRGVAGSANKAQGQDINVNDPQFGWGYISSFLGDSHCNEKHYLYCVGPYNDAD